MSRLLPPGQRERADFPRFGLAQFAYRFPNETSRPEIRVVGEVAQELVVQNVLEGLPQVEQVSDFHCVTTWSRRSIRWGGVRFVEFYERVLLAQARPLPHATFLILRGQDGARTSFLLRTSCSPTRSTAGR